MGLKCGMLGDPPLRHLISFSYRSGWRSWRPEHLSSPVFSSRAHVSNTLPSAVCCALGSIKPQVLGLGLESEKGRLMLAWTTCVAQIPRGLTRRVWASFSSDSQEKGSLASPSSTLPGAHHPWKQVPCSLVTTPLPFPLWPPASPQ